MIDPMSVNESSFFINVATPGTTTAGETLFSDDVSPFPTFDEDSLISNNSIETEPVRPASLEECESDDESESSADESNDSESDEDEDDDDSSSDDSSAPPLPEDIGYVIDANGVSLLANLNRKMLEHRYGKDYKFDKVPVTTKIDVDEAVFVMEKMKGLLQDGSVSREDFEMAVIPKSPSSASEIMTCAGGESNYRGMESPEEAKEKSTKDLEKMMKSLSKDDLQVLYKAIMGKEMPENADMESRQDCETAGNRNDGEETDPFDMPLPSILEESLSGSTASIEVAADAPKNDTEEEQPQDENVAAVANTRTPKKGFGMLKKLNVFKKKVTGKKSSKKSAGKNLPTAANNDAKPITTTKVVKKTRLSPIAFLQAASGSKSNGINTDVEERDSPEPINETAAGADSDESKLKEEASPEAEITASESNSGPLPEQVTEPDLMKGPTDESEEGAADVVEAFDSLCLSLGSPRTTAATNIGSSQDDEQHVFDDALEARSETRETVAEDTTPEVEPSQDDSCHAALSYTCPIPKETENPLEVNTDMNIVNEVEAASMEESVEVADVIEEQNETKTAEILEADEPVVQTNSDLISAVSEKNENSESIEVELAPLTVLPEAPLSPATADTGEKSFGRRFSKALLGKKNKPTSPGSKNDDIKLTPENPVIEIPLSEMKPRRSLMSKYAEKTPKTEPEVISPSNKIPQAVGLEHVSLGAESGLENDDIKPTPENPVIEIPLSPRRSLMSKYAEKTPEEAEVISPSNKKPQAVGLEHVSLGAESPKAKESEKWKSSDISVSSKKSSKSKKSTKAKKKLPAEDDPFVVKANDTLETRDECSLRGFSESGVESFEEAGNIMFCCMRDPNVTSVEKSFTQFFDYCDHTPEEAYENTKVYEEKHSTEDESMSDSDRARSRSKTRSDKSRSDKSSKSRSKSRSDKSIKSKGDKSTKSRSNKSTKSTKSKSEKSIKSKGEKSIKSKGEKTAKSSISRSKSVRTKKVSNTTTKATPAKDTSTKKVSSSANIKISSKNATAKASATPKTQPKTTATMTKAVPTNTTKKSKSASAKFASLKVNTKADAPAAKSNKAVPKAVKHATTKSRTSNAASSKNSTLKTKNNVNATKLKAKTNTASKKVSKTS